MWSRLIVLCNPGIKISLQLRNRAIELLAEGDAVELVQQRLVETLADAVGLWAPRFGARVVDILDREVELVFVPLRLAAELRTSVSEYTADDDGNVRSFV